MELLTIFTPTYNRKEKIKILYESLKNQTCKDFVWLIVDDGSVDDTAGYIESISEDASFRIEYFYQENRGKSNAHNKGVELTKTPLFTCVDSDDYITSECVEKIKEKWKTKGIGDIGILAFCSQTKVSPSFPTSSIRLKEAYEKYKLKGDTMLVYESSAISQFRFPSFPNEKFVPENYLYDLLDQVGTLLVLPYVLYIREYCSDGYTRNMGKLIKNNPQGYEAYISQRIKIDKGIKQLYLDTIRHIAILKVIGKGILPYVKHKVIALLAYPFGLLLYIKRYR